MISIDPQDVTESFDVRRMLECAAAEITVRQATAEEIGELRAIADEMSQLLEVDDYQTIVGKYIELDHRFHGMFETFMFNTVTNGLRFLQQIDSPSVKLQLDTFHINLEEDNIAQAIRQAGDTIGHFHCAANNRKMPGRGHIDWAEGRSAGRRRTYVDDRL